MKRIWIPVLATILAWTAGCNGGSSTGPSGTPTGGTFSATVDGVAWTTDVVTAVRQSGVVVVTGADASVFSVQIGDHAARGNRHDRGDRTHARGRQGHVLLHDRAEQLRDAGGADGHGGDVRRVALGPGRSRRAGRRGRPAVSEGAVER